MNATPRLTLQASPLLQRVSVSCTMAIRVTLITKLREAVEERQQP